MQTDEIRERIGPMAGRHEDLFDLLAGTLDGVFAVDHDQRISFWNEAAARILGFEPEAVIGRRCYEVLSGCDARGCAICGRGCGAFRASLRGRLSPTRPVQVLAKGDTRKWVVVTTFVVPSHWHELSLLAHVFRETSAGGRGTEPWREALGSPALDSQRSMPRSPGGSLTRREAQILCLLAAGASTARICGKLGIHATTARSHVQHLLDKLGVHSRLEAVAAARRGEFPGGGA